MQIVIFSWRDITNPRAGGAERMTLEHAKRWVAAGHAVTLFTSSYPQARPEEDIAGVRVLRHGTEYSVHVLARHWYRRLRSRPDLVIDEIHGLPFGAAAYAGVPVLAWIYEVARDIWFRMYPFPVAISGRFLETVALHWYARQELPFVTDSSSTANDLAATGVSRKQITVIEPAIGCVPLSTIPEKEAVPTLAYVGRLVPMKGVADAIEACAQVGRQYRRCRLWIIGQGKPAYVADLQRLIQRLNLEESVELCGWLSEEEKLRRLRRAHLLIHPSQREGWGINVIEANAMATPAIGYSVPGLRDSIVQGTTGILCSDRRPLALANAASSLLAHAERYHAMQHAALAWSARFTWDGAAQRSLALITRLAGSCRPMSQEGRACV